ncbi:cAMP-dependent protein kinase inhibitor gamma isoform X2 [Phascolarctos cinereus]|uniref:cAMP-dependent protein kinase inhibitor gamma isoform X2 n=1 Tax=Phascolarctos cinereus TaxID=38626 RepID=A0A6P5K3P2_PHACI|nr:cAMP-dependent protein kinase inhibitor gamma isoform X2 [Phascolarctos cinereus]
MELIPKISQETMKEHPAVLDEFKSLGTALLSNARGVMEVESSYTDFISCDRTGRRNAVPDIQDDSAAVSVRKLTGNMEELALEGTGQAEINASDKEAGTRPEGNEGTATS